MKQLFLILMVTAAACTKDHTEPINLPLKAVPIVLQNVDKTVSLDASQSYTQGPYQITKYAWSITEAPNNSLKKDYLGDKHQLTLPPGVYLFRLEVWDSRGKTDYVYQSVTVK